MQSRRHHFIRPVLFILNAFAVPAYAIHQQTPLNVNPLAPPAVIPASPSAPTPSATSKPASTGGSFGYGGKTVDGSAMSSPSPTGTGSGFSLEGFGSPGFTMSPPSSGAPASTDTGDAAGGDGTMLASSGENSYYGNMDLVKDLKGFSDKADLKTGVAEKFIDPRTRRPLSAADILSGKRVLMVTPSGNTISGTFDVDGGQNLAKTANNVKDPRFSYTQLFGASQSFLEGRVFGFKPDQPTSDAAVGMKPSQIDYYAADAATIAQMKTQGTKTQIALYALKYNPGDGSFDIIGGGGGGGAAGAAGGAAAGNKQLNLGAAGANVGGGGGARIP